MVVPRVGAGSKERVEWSPAFLALLPVVGVRNQSISSHFSCIWLITHWEVSSDGNQPRFSACGVSIPTLAIKQHHFLYQTTPKNLKILPQTPAKPTSFQNTSHFQFKLQLLGKI